MLPISHAAALHPTAAHSERHSCAQLNLPHVSRAPDLSERRGGVKAGARVEQVDDVEHVRRLEAELEHGSALQRDVAEDTEVDVSHGGSVDDVAAGIACRTDCRRGARGDVEPAL